MKTSTNLDCKCSLQQIKNKVRKKYTKSFANALVRMAKQLYDKGISPTSNLVIKTAMTKKSN